MNNTIINFNYKGEEYKLEYSKNAIKIIEAQGFDVNNFLDKPMTNIELAFTGAFIKNHPKISTAKVSEMLESCPNKQELVAALIQMINEQYSGLTEEPTEEDSKNVSWSVI